MREPSVREPPRSRNPLGPGFGVPGWRRPRVAASLGVGVRPGLTGPADDDLIGFDGDGHVTLAGPVFGVDLNVLDGGIEPEAVAFLAVVEGAFEAVVLPAPAPSAASAAPSPGPAFGLRTVSFVVVAVFLATAVFLVVFSTTGFPVGGGRCFLLGPGPCLLGFGLGSSGFLCGGCRLDLGFDFVAEIDLCRGIVVVARSKIMLAAELAEFGGAYLKLMGDPGIRASLLDPGPDLVELGAK